MIEVISVRFKNRGKSYYFAPNGFQVEAGTKVIVETSKGLEIVDCCRGNHMVMDTSVVQPLRPVVRIATQDDLRVEEINKRREKEAFEICQQKIAEHGLDMRLVDVECNFEGNKTMFFFTSDGRVDFRGLVKDLAGIFRNRIELRQIGVRDEAKMIGGIGICGRPYCCSQFLDEFQPVSTKMAKIQSLSLNPAKISGSCGRLMCCLRYEQEAYEELIKKVPKQGAFVETKDGYGTAVQVNLLRQTVKVKLDDDGDDSLRQYKANELAAVPGMSQIYFNPACRNITSARGRIPNASGRIVLDWKLTDTNELVVNIDSNHPLDVLPMLDGIDIADSTFNLGNYVNLLDPDSGGEEPEKPA